MSDQATPTTEQPAAAPSAITSQAVELKDDPTLPIQWIASPETDQIWPAVVRAWAKVPKVEKNAVGQVFKNGQHMYDWKYAKLDAVEDALRSNVAEQGCGIFFRPVTIKGHPGHFLACQVLHGDSQQYVGYLMPLDFKGSSQDFGSQVTYRMRYGICAFFFIAPVDDDDGNAENGQNFVPTNDQEPRGAKSTSGEGAPPRPAAGGSRPAAKQSASQDDNAGAARLVQPPKPEAVVKRISQIESIDDLKAWLENALTYQALAQAPQAWPTVMQSVSERIDGGSNHDGWDSAQCDQLADWMWGMWPQVGKNAIDAIATPEALARWLQLFYDSYWNGDHDQLRELEQWSEILRYAVNRSSRGLKDENWSPAVCDGPLTDEIKRHQLAIKQLLDKTVQENPDDNPATTEQAEQEGDAQAEPEQSDTPETTGDAAATDSD